MPGIGKIVTGAVLAAGLLGGAARPLAHKAVFPGADAALPPGDALASRFPGAERLAYASGDGTPLAAAWIPATAPRATAIYFHATNQAAADALFFARDLAARGVSTCVPEHRGYGGLPGTPSVDAILEDAEAAIAACGARGRGPLILVGRSLGAGVAAEMARREHGDALVLVSPFTTLSEVASPFGAALPDVDRLDARAALREARVPVAIVHGTSDMLIPFRMGQELARETGAELVALPGVGHNQLFLGDARGALLDAIERVPFMTRSAGLMTHAAPPPR